jgi:hypothetical protein
VLAEDVKQLFHGEDGCVPRRVKRQTNSTLLPPSDPRLLAAL